MLTVFSILGALGTIFIPFPQAKRAYFHSTKGVSAATYIALCSIAAIFIPHGIRIDSLLLSVSHVFSVIFCSVIIYSIARDNKNKSIIFILVVIVVVMLGIYFLSNDIGKTVLISSIVSFLRLPQLYKACFAPEIHGISVLTWLMAVVANISWLIVAIIKDDTPLILGASLSVFLSASIVVVTSIRQHKLKEVSTSSSTSLEI
ncbi:MAG TPA: hypothetical protein PKB15_01165 [Acidimicrobiia bacterium]|nr:hypothetical protein [Acidimicrobiia bacterium]